MRGIEREDQSYGRARLANLFLGGIAGIFQILEKIVATPASLKTLKVMLFKVNDAMNSALNLAGQIETQIIKK